MTLDPTQWFTEINGDSGAAFSLAIKRKVHEEQTPFQKIEIYETETFGNLMIIDGCYMVSTRDNFFYHEMMSHPTLYSHPSPKRVIVIGGGDCGTLREVLRHPEVEFAMQVEIDERVTRLAEVYFPELCESNNDPRAELYFGDGIKWMKEAAPESMDVVIVDSTDPIGPAEGLFSQAFFQDVWRALRPGGMIVQQSEAPLYHTESIILPLHQKMKRAGFAYTKTFHFPQTIYPSGWWTGTIASKDRPIEGFREDAVKARAFKMQYYNEDIHRAAFAMPEFWKGQF
jgi:spermidine synthase